VKRVSVREEASAASLSLTPLSHGTALAGSSRALAPALALACSWSCARRVSISRVRRRSSVAFAEAAEGVGAKESERQLGLSRTKI